MDTSAPDSILEAKKKRSADIEDLKNAKMLMKETKQIANSHLRQMVPTSKKTLDGVFTRVSELLDLPHDWRKDLKPDTVQKGLEKLIQETSDVVESPEEYTCDLDIAFMASGGRALCGIYHSEYKSVETAGQPILLKPETIQMFNAGQRKEIHYKYFTKQGAAAQFVQAVESNGINIGFAAEGFYDLLAGRLESGYDVQDGVRRTAKSSFTSVSVVQCMSITMKEFHIDESRMELSERVKEEAMSIAEAGDNADGRRAARYFMRMYGSHVPAGNHKLGGIFFSIGDAQSYSRMETTRLSRIARRELEARISAGFLGGAFSVSGGAQVKNASTSGTAEERETGETSISYEYSMEVIGPLASNPKTFENLLSYNSTWAVIDRGPPHSYIPVWKLIRRCDTSYELAADILEKTWEEDEKENERKWEEWKEKIAEQNRRKAELEAVREELERTRKDHLNRRYRWGKSYRPKDEADNANGTLIFEKDWMEHEDAYNEAIQHIMKDPDHTICKIVYWWHICGGGYSLRCWKARDDTPMIFEEVRGGHVLFFSEVRFKWKDQVLLRG